MNKLKKKKLKLESCKQQRRSQLMIFKINELCVVKGYEEGHTPLIQIKRQNVYTEQ